MRTKNQSDNNINHVVVSGNIIQQDHIDQKLIWEAHKPRYINQVSPFGEYPDEQ